MPTQAEITTLIANNIPDNTTKQIHPADMREVCNALNTSDALVSSKMVQFIGDGITYVFSTPNDFTPVAGAVQVTPLSSDAIGIQSITITSSTITWQYDIAPPPPAVSGQNNLVFNITKLTNGVLV